MAHKKNGKHPSAGLKGAGRKRVLTADPVAQFIALTDDQKATVAKEFDREFVADTFSPLPARQQKVWQRLKTALGKSKNTKAVRVISLPVDKGLLKRADDYAKKAGLSRAELVARGLERELAGAVLR